MAAIDDAKPGAARRGHPAPAGCPPGAAKNNVERVARLESEVLEARPLSARCAAGLMRVCGTATFALAHAVWFTAWIAINAGAIPGVPAFDPYPFNFLTLVVSLESIFLAIWILVSQNEMMRLADRRAHLDLQINMLAEQESTAAIRMLQRISEHLGIESGETLDAALAEETDVERIVSDIDHTVPS